MISLILFSITENIIFKMKDINITWKIFTCEFWVDIIDKLDKIFQLKLISIKLNNCFFVICNNCIMISICLIRAGSLYRYAGIDADAGIDASHKIAIFK